MYTYMYIYIYIYIYIYGRYAKTLLRTLSRLCILTPKDFIRTNSTVTNKQLSLKTLC